MTLRRAHLYWLCQIGGWSSWMFVGLSYAYVMSGGSAAALWPALPTYIASIVSSIGWSHLYRLYIRRRGWAALSLGKLLPRLVPASFALGVVIPYATLPLYLILYPDRAQVFGMWVLPAVVGTTWCAGIWNVAYFGVHYFER